MRNYRYENQKEKWPLFENYFHSIGYHGPEIEILKNQTDFQFVFLMDGLDEIPWSENQNFVDLTGMKYWWKKGNNNNFLLTY